MNWSALFRSFGMICWICCRSMAKKPLFSGFLASAPFITSTWFACAPATRSWGGDTAAAWAWAAFLVAGSCRRTTAALRCRSCITRAKRGLAAAGPDSLGAGPVPPGAPGAAGKAAWEAGRSLGFGRGFLAARAIG